MKMEQDSVQLTHYAFIFLLLSFPMPFVSATEDKDWCNSFKQDYKDLCSANEDAYLCRAAEHKCPCQDAGQVLRGNYTFDLVYTGQQREINCCVTQILGYEDPNAQVTWTFRGQPLVVNDFELKGLFCNKETLVIGKVEEADEGSYTCLVRSSSNGTHASLTTDLKVYPTNEYRVGPQEIHTRPMQEAFTEEVGSPINFACSVYVGTPTYPHLQPRLNWFYVLPNGDVSNVLNGNHITRTTTINNNGTMTGYLEIQSLNERHFGTYICYVTNFYGCISSNITLIYGQNPEIYRAKMALVTIVIIIGIVLGALYCCQRFGRNVLLHFRQPSNSGGLLYDVFIVHGDSVEDWVIKVLLPTLETTYKYKCFLPNRNMLAGEQMADSIMEAVTQSHRVLVVISPCLLRSPWARWEVDNGISFSLASETRIMAVLLQEPGNDTISSESAGFLKTLQMMKKIKVPKSCKLEEILEEPALLCEVSKSICERNEEIIQESYKPIFSEYMMDGYPLQLPKTQLLNNMITSSNNASLENLTNEGKDLQAKNQKRIRKLPAIYIEENAEGGDDLGTPCSTSPIILPSIKEKKYLQTCGSLFKFLRNVFLGDPEVLFWQTLRLRLDRPGIRSINTRDDCKA